MKIFVSHNGDSSVGISGDELVIDWPAEPCYWTSTAGDRENLRRGLQEFWKDYMDHSQIRVRFEDECNDCGKQGFGVDENGQRCCKNPNCISNIPDED